MEKFSGYTKRDIQVGVNNDNIPDDLQKEKRWVVYTVFWDDKKVKWCKVPVYETANSFKFYGATNPLTIDKCLTYADACVFYRKDFTSRHLEQTVELYGLGFYLPGSDFSCVDLDYRKTKTIADSKIILEKDGRCLDEQGKINAATQDLINRLFPNWVEYSVSQTGLHIWYKGASPLNYGPDGKTKQVNFDYTVNGETIYGQWYDAAAPDNQFIALTGHQFNGGQ